MGKAILPVAAAWLILAAGCRQPSEKIFNGKDLSNWNFRVEEETVPPGRVYSVEKGVISIEGEPMGYMYTKKRYRNYTLELEYRWVSEPGNSGVFFAIEEPGNPFPKGVECQLMNGKAGDLVLLSGAHLEEYSLPEGTAERPEFPVVEKKRPSSEKPAGEWNRVKIIVKEGVANIYINDVHQNTGTSPVKEGHIGLQSEGTKIEFRNVTLTEPV